MGRGGLSGGILPSLSLGRDDCTHIQYMAILCTTLLLGATMTLGRIASRCGEPHHLSSWTGYRESDIVDLLELAFTQKALRDLCESQLKAERRFGINVAKRLRARLADLREAETAGDLVAGQPRKSADADECMDLDLGEGVRLIFKANHVANPRTRSGQVDWAKVSRIKILEIGASNG